MLRVSQTQRNSRYKGPEAGVWFGDGQHCLHWYYSWSASCEQGSGYAQVGVHMQTEVMERESLGAGLAVPPACCVMKIAPLPLWALFLSLHIEGQTLMCAQIIWVSHWCEHSGSVGPGRYLRSCISKELLSAKEKNYSVTLVKDGKEDFLRAWGVVVTKLA